MIKSVKKKPGKLPKEKKKSPLGRQAVPELPSIINFACKEQNRAFLITTVSNNKGYPVLLNREQNDNPPLADASNDDPSQAQNSTAAWRVKIFLN